METSPKISPFCIHLDSKKIILAENAPLTEGDVLDASNYCWCRITCQVFGPDRRQVSPEGCQKGRDCFESPLESML